MMVGPGAPDRPSVDGADHDATFGWCCEDVEGWPEIEAEKSACSLLGKAEALSAPFPAWPPGMSLTWHRS